MNIEYWPVDKPIDYPKNARKWSKDAVSKVARSLQDYGFRQPIVVDEAGVIIIGHLRRTAARSAGIVQVPVHVATGLSPEKVRGLRLADNRTHEEADWDLELLAAELGELKATGFDLAATAFEPFEIDPPARGDASKLAERFIIPPFSVLDARQGYWQERKRSWLALGIESELGRGGRLEGVRDRQPN